MGPELLCSSVSVFVHLLKVNRVWQLLASLLQELTCYMGSQSVTCHPAEVTFPPVPQPKLVLGLVHPGVNFLFIIVCNLAQTL